MRPAWMDDRAGTASPGVAAESPRSARRLVRAAAVLFALVASLASGAPAAHGDSRHLLSARPVAYCDSCPDPTVTTLGVEFRQGDLWTLGGDGTLTRLAGCSPAQVVAIQGFRGLAKSLGYDNQRDEFIVADRELRAIDVVDMTGRVVRSFPAPSTSPSGITYDSTRDVYWTIDADADSLYALDPDDGGRVTVLPLPTCTFCTGAAYDAGLDAIYYSDPAVFIDDHGVFTTRYHYVSCTTGGLLGSYPLPYTAIQDWEDNAIGPTGSLWIQNINVSKIYCMDRQTTPVRSVTWGQLKLRYR